MQWLMETLLVVISRRQRRGLEANLVFAKMRTTQCTETKKVPSAEHCVRDTMALYPPAQYPWGKHCICQNAHHSLHTDEESARC